MVNNQTCTTIREDALTERPKRWRNLWYALKDHVDTAGTFHHEGSTEWGQPVYTTRREAELSAEGWLNESDSDVSYRLFAAHIGAFELSEGTQ